MAGLLDTGDPEKDAALYRGLLTAGLQLMQSRGKFLPALSQGGLAGLSGYENETNRQLTRKRVGLQDEILRNQADEQKRQAALQQIAGQYIKPDQQGNNPSSFVPGSMDLPGLVKAYMAAPGGLQTGLALQGVLQKQEPKLESIPAGGLGGYFKDGRFVEVARNPKEDANTTPSAIKEYQFAVDQGYKGTFDQWDQTRRKSSATSVKIENQLGGGLAKEVGPMIADSAQQAQGAQQQIQNADALIRAVDSNKVYAGPGANIKLKGAQIGQLIGVGGKDAADTITNTRSVIQGLARATVAARSALKGQGQVSDFEGKLLARAESGDIEDLTASEIKQIATVNKRLAGQLVDRHQRLIQKAKANPTTAGVVDFFDVPSQGQSLDWGSLPSGR